METIKTLLMQLKGVISIAEIAEKHREEIIKRETSYENGGVIGLENPGIRMVIERQKVVAILKDTSFRPPPGPTVFMVEKVNTTEDNGSNYISFNNKSYFIVGEELIGSEPPKDEEYMFIGDDFVLYPERRKGKTNKPAFFLIPPIEFTELEKIKSNLGIENIISVSPSTIADDYIREQFNFSKKNNYATILIGFDKKAQ